MKAKQTKGPWSYRKNGVSFQIWNGQSEIAKTSGVHYDNESNAMLLASSPEMLQALEAAWYAMIKFAEKDCEREINLARNALNKALGK